MIVAVMLLLSVSFYPYAGLAASEAARCEEHLSR